LGPERRTVFLHNFSIKKLIEVGVMIIKFHLMELSDGQFANFNGFHNNGQFAVYQRQGFYGTISCAVCPAVSGFMSNNL